ncbi:type IV pilin protein [Stutzerimonas stutzeri]|uniref:Prepilin-type cleavage/methylation domain-containing protein n=1 Tax=Stutzerimonas stutzeri TaxID=316 RepID=A0A2N8S506_STUST|nr:type IV pilin protein [Stutzerimonas stutzeri]PNF81704.1 prepilin-type cleavage/methylation domain-containing protein [Stutzerimonas stutzeri]
MARHLARGFTLIEVMIVVVIIGILASIALPNYRQYVVRSNRTAAQAQMLDIANRQQHFLLANRSYADTPALTASGFSLSSEVSPHYSFAVTVGSGTVPSYLITFTAVGSQASDGNLTLDNEGTKTPADKW